MLRLHLLVLGMLWVRQRPDPVLDQRGVPVVGLLVGGRDGAVKHRTFHKIKRSDELGPQQDPLNFIVRVDCGARLVLLPLTTRPFFTEIFGDLPPLMDSHH